MRRKIIMGLLGVFILCPTVFATGINIYINNGGITNRDGGALPDSEFHPYASKLEFFYNTLPAPNSASGRLSVDVATQHTVSGAQHKYQLTSYNGGRMYVRAWNGSVAPTAAGNNYYGLADSPVASGTTLPIDWTTSISTVYKADVPFTPAVGTIGEALIRTGSTMVLTLTVPVAYNELSGTERRQITGRSLEIVYPGGTTETRVGDTISLANVPTGTYRFTPIATNWYGSTRGTTVSYTTLGLGSLVGAALTINYDLRHPSGLLGINPIAVPFATISSPEGITQVKHLVNKINEAAGTSNRVAAIGWWDITNQRPAGYLINYSATGVPTYLRAGAPAALPAENGDQTLSTVPNGILQISLERETTGAGIRLNLTGSGTR
ncbi:hypothetical protein HZB07_06790 [Candidatus Saganbacteria bacterium]|nr:hypothetical protein [Candidatus Saganbacteria bacterium]